MTNRAPSRLRLLKTEDYWAIWLGVFIVLLALTFFWAGFSLQPWAVKPGAWSGVGDIGADIAAHGLGYLSLYVGLGAVFAVSMGIMGRSIRQYLKGFSVFFLGSLAIFYLAGWSVMQLLDLDAPLLALIVGLVVGNLVTIPEWMKTSLRTEYYIKTGIVLLGATLPLTLIAEAGPVALD